jgi:bacterioferritin-associated ferredoxin
MIVCVCRRVSDREIARHARAGMGFDEIQFELGVATQCGQCESCARDVVAQCSPNSPVAAMSCDAATAPEFAVQLSPRIQESRAWPSAQPQAAA